MTKQPSILVPSITLPKYPTARSMLELLECVGQLKAASSTGAICDGHAVVFIDPCAMAVFACIADYYQKHNIRLELIKFPRHILSYLSRMDSFEGFIDSSCEQGVRHDRRLSLQEVRKISKGENVEEAAEALVLSLLGSMDDLPEGEEPDEMSCMTKRDTLEIPLKYIFSELLDNVFQHGVREGFDAAAWVCAQYYSEKETVRFAIVDNGCGILSSLDKHPDLLEKSNRTAIQLALRERTSGNPTFLMMGGDHSANQGVGLTVVSKMIKGAGGKMWIASGDASLELTNKDILEQVVSPWQGSILAAEINRSSLMSIRVYDVIATLEGSKDRVKLDFS